MQSLSVGPLWASVRENLWLAKAVTRGVQLMACMRIAPAPIVLAPVCSSNVLWRSGNASTVAEAEVERSD